MVPLLGLGTVKFGRTAKVSYPHPYVLPSDEQIADLLALAKSLGVTLLDTAPAYGTSERRIGEAIAGERADWLLCSKAGEEFGALGGGARGACTSHEGALSGGARGACTSHEGALSGGARGACTSHEGALSGGARGACTSHERDGSRYDFGEDHILRSVERSLRRLCTDYLDILLVHADGRNTERIVAAGAFRALRRLQGEGVVRAVGFSAKSEVDGSAALTQSDVLMCTANATCDSQASLIARAGEEGVGVLVKKPLASGHHADPQALAKLSQMPGVSCIVVGTIDADHLAANAAALATKSPS